MSKRAELIEGERPRGDPPLVTGDLREKVVSETRNFIAQTHLQREETDQFTDRILAIVERDAVERERKTKMDDEKKTLTENEPHGIIPPDIARKIANLVRENDVYHRSLIVMGVGAVLLAVLAFMLGRLTI